MLEEAVLAAPSQIGQFEGPKILNMLKLSAPLVQPPHVQWESPSKLGPRLLGKIRPASAV